MSDGELVEFDTPHVLLSNSESVFSQLVNSTGTITADKLKHSAALPPVIGNVTTQLSKFIVL